MRTVLTRAFRNPTGTERVDAKALEDLSAMAGGRSFIVPIRGEVAGYSFETAILAIADNVAEGYTIGAIVSDGIDPSMVKVSVVKLPGLDAQASPIPVTH